MRGPRSTEPAADPVVVLQPPVASLPPDTFRFGGPGRWLSRRRRQAWAAGSAVRRHDIVAPIGGLMVQIEADRQTTAGA